MSSQALVARSQQQALSSRTATLEDLAEAFLQDQDVSEMSRAAYSRSLKQFILWLQQTGRASRLATLQREDVLAYKDSLSSSGKSAYTVSSYLTIVRKLYAWLEGRKLYPDIAKDVKGAKKPRGFRKDTLSEDQLRQALSTIDRSSQEGLRDYALFNLLARTGLRTVEVARATVGDIRQEPGLKRGERVLWIQGKGRDSKDDFVLLTKEALQPIQEYLQLRGRTSAKSPLFSSISDRNSGQPLTTRSISRIIKQALRQIGLDDSRLTAHSMRHTAISLAVYKGASLQQAQAMARHSDAKTTLVYFHNMDRIKAGAERFISF